MEIDRRAFLIPANLGRLSRLVVKLMKEVKSKMKKETGNEQRNPCMTVFVSSGRNQKTNTSYPFPSVISSVDDLKEAASYDHVSARYADGKNNRGRLIKAYRSKMTFTSSDCLPMDCDNCNPNPLEDDVPENDWKTPADVRSAFPDVPFYVVYRNA